MCAFLFAAFYLAASAPAQAHFLGGLPPPPPTPLWKVVLLVVAAALVLAELGFVALRPWRARGAEPGRGAEGWWAATPLLLLVLMGVARLLPGASAAASVTVLRPGASAPGALVVDVDARQYEWQFHCPQEKASSRNELYVPVGRDLVFRLTSRDVLHSLDIPGLGIQQDVYFGRPVTLGVRIPQPGRYDIVCTALCGSGAPQMRGVLVAEPPADFERWLRSQATAVKAPTSSR